MMKCRHGEKKWSGDDALCGFTLSGVFSKNNWNCGLLNDLRDWVGEGDSDCVRAWKDDENIYVKAIPTELQIGIFLVMTIYKSRGHVENVWVTDGMHMRQIREKEAKKILAFSTGDWKGLK